MIFVNLINRIRQRIAEIRKAMECRYIMCPTDIEFHCKIIFYRKANDCLLHVSEVHKCQLISFEEADKLRKICIEEANEAERKCIELLRYCCAM